MDEKGEISNQIVELLEEKYLKFNQREFIENDPISIPHRFEKKQDIEISGFFAAILAWGQRKTIIKNCDSLLEKMDDAPYDYVLNATARDLKKLENFVHRTFNSVDLLYFISFLNQHFQKFDSLEDAFIRSEVKSVKDNLIAFNTYFFSLDDFPIRTKKHISSPSRHSACKRLNMFLRWMVRKDIIGVDFGLWEKIPTSTLICPCDIHVEKTAKILRLTNRKKADWEMAAEITCNLKKIDPIDPVRFDFALFGLGVEKYFDGF
jgi:uncharacterized protein (TIGR02757 family)